MNKDELITMLESHIKDHEATIDELLKERDSVEMDAVRAILDDAIGNYSRMVLKNNEMIKELKL
jgi:frataxin-like iron-binding protein CyaY